jgi:VCBS repeat-containing protein
MKSTIWKKRLSSYLLLALVISLLNFNPAQAVINLHLFDPQVTFATEFNPHGLAIGDLDANGLPDLAVTNSTNHTVSILRNNSTVGTMDFSTQVPIITGNTPFGVAIGDLDGDGKSDLAVANDVAGSVSVLRNTSTGGNLSFAAQAFFAAEVTPFELVISDLDGDSKPDLAVTNRNGYKISILRNISTVGSIAFDPRVSFDVGLYPHGLAIADLDGDSKPDMVAANRDADNISVLRNISESGTLAFEPQENFGAGIEPYDVNAGDLDGDGKPDLVVTNYVSNTVSAFLNTSTSGDIALAPQVTFGTGSNPVNVVIQDFDRDSKPELAVTNYGGSTVSILGNTSAAGSIAFAGQIPFAVGTFPVGVASADLDGDLETDLAVVNRGGNTVSVLENMFDLVPPDTEITATPPALTNSTTASFSFSSDDPEAGFLCKLDEGAFAPCTSPHEYTGLGSGEHTFTVQALDLFEIADPEPSSYTWEIDLTPVCQALTLGTDEDTVATIQPDCADESVASLQYAIVQQPEHGEAEITLAGLLEYTPDSDFHGPDVFTFTADDGFSTSAPATVTVTVLPVNDAPVCQAVTLHMDEDTTGSVAPDCSDVDNNVSSLTYQIDTPPNHGTAAVVAGQLQYTPDDDYNGADVFTYTASDGGDTSAPVTVTVVIAAVNTPPACQAVTLITVEDTAGTAAPDCSDVDNEISSLTNQIAAQPAHGTAAVVAGQLQYTPEGNYNGADTFTYTASDGDETSAPALVNVTVTAVNDAPVCQDITIETSEDTPRTTDPDCSDVDDALATLTFQIETQPGHGTAEVIDGQLRYEPDENYFGPDSFTYSASDGDLTSAPAAVNMTVGGINEAPVCQDVVLNTNEDTTGSAAPDCFDIDNDLSSLTYQIVTPPAHGAAAVVAGELRYTPEENYNGPDTFTYTASDGALTSLAATVTVTVAAMNDLPDTQADGYQAVFGTELVVSAAEGLLANDSDVESPNLTAVAGTGPAHGELTLNSDGSFTYTPDLGFKGVDTFTYFASDGSAQSPATTVTITVQSFTVYLPFISH